MNLSEYTTKQLLKAYNLPMPREYLFSCIDEEKIQRVIEEIGDSVYLKAQIMHGGRQMGRFKNNTHISGVEYAHGCKDIKHMLSMMLGDRLITKQTDTHGEEVKCVQISEKIIYQKEIYLSLFVDRDTHAVNILASASGGVHVERDACTRRWEVDAHIGILPYQMREVREYVQLPMELYPSLADILTNLYRAMIEYDLLLLEINPLVVTDSKQLIILDAYAIADDAAKYRHEFLFDTCSCAGACAQSLDVRCVTVHADGSIACITNGAGLAMASIDLLHHIGGCPINFLDIGGGAHVDQIVCAFAELIKYKQKKVIYVNIFGGMASCLSVAHGILASEEQSLIPCPLVVRFAGVDAEEGYRVLSKKHNKNYMLESNFFRSATIAVNVSNV